jgi:hypothetical protein
MLSKDARKGIIRCRVLVLTILLNLMWEGGGDGQEGEEDGGCGELHYEIG